MADNGGRGGGLGWFLVGLLIGVAGTLATQKFIHSGEGPAPAVVESAAPASDTPAPDAEKPKPVAHKSASSASPSASATHDDQSLSDVADDAAAAGMTSRRSRQTQPDN